MIALQGLIFMPFMDTKHDDKQSGNKCEHRGDNGTDDMNPDVTLCGVGSWRPKWLQVLARPTVFLFNFTLIGLIQGMTGSYLIASMSTLEKRFAFDSKIAGFLMIADNIVQIIVNPIIGYFGSRFNRPRMIAAGELILALSCFTTALPYFIYGAGTHLLHDDNLLSTLGRNETRYELCPANGADTDCSGGKHSTVWPAVAIIYLGCSLKGLGFTAYYIIGIPYMDDIVSKRSSPVYISLISAVNLLGPAGGFILASFTLRYYEDAFYNPGTIAAIKRLVNNPILVLHLIASTLRWIGNGGYQMFKSKYIESHFHQTSAGAGLLTGTTSMPAMAVGIMLGGIAITWIKPRPRSLVIYMVLVEFLASSGILGAMYINCPALNIGNYRVANSGFTMNYGCNQHCKCTTRLFTPICAADGVTTYFSPCFAGCGHLDRPNKTLSECACIGSGGQGGGGAATTGYCKRDVSSCNKIVPYLSIISLGSMIASTTRTGSLLITLRSVDSKDKSFAIGMMSTFISLFAFIPYPLIFGAITDSACLVWESTCGKRGNCWLYDQDKFRYYLHGVAFGFMFMGAMVDLVIIFMANWIKNFYDEPTTDDGSDCHSTGIAVGVGSDDNDQNNSENNEFERQDSDNDPELTECGLGSWRPQWLQRFATPTFFTLNFALIGIVQSMTGTYLIASFSTLEKRFAFDSKIAGFILIADNVVEMLVHKKVSPIVGYLGNRFNRPRMIATGELVLALSCLINALPYFIYGAGTHLLHRDTQVGDHSVPMNGTRFEMCPINHSDIDCSTGRHSTVWPAVVIFLIGSAFRGLGYTAYWVIGMPYIDDSVSKNNSPMFISGLTALRLIGPAMGVLLLIFTLPMFLFPKQLKTASVKAKDLKEHDITGLRGMWDGVKRLARNRIFMFHLVGGVFRYIGFGGYYINKTKYIESQFRYTSSGASFITGATSVLPMAVGILLGGLMIKYFKPRPFRLVVYMFVVEWFTNGAFFAAMFIGCPPLTLPSTLTINNHARCNAGCDCTTSVFTPICGSDKSTTYFSPCYAGCHTIDRVAKSIGLFVHQRVIDPKDKSFAMGMIGTFLALFSFIPYPLIFGAVVDSACMDKFRYMLHGVALLFVCVGSVFDLGIVLNAKSIKNFYDDSTADEETDPKSDDKNHMLMTATALNTTGADNRDSDYETAYKVDV
ncbi:unnamed protein product, partial [Medioppia subpectinata]